MKSKKAKIILLASIGAFVSGLAAAFFFVAEPKINFNAQKNGVIEVFSTAEVLPPDACLSVLGLELPLELKYEGKVNNNAVGKYPLTYETEFLWKKLRKTYEVQVVDTVAPIIEPSDFNFVCNYPGRALLPEEVGIGYIATDNYDGNITDKVTKTVNGNICTLSVSDSSGNTASIEINIIFRDNTAPTITFKGGNPVYHLAGKSYAEPGFSAVDNVDGDITSLVSVSGKVDGNKSGVYPVEYSVTDSAGNTSKLVRKVIVYGTMTAEDYSQISKNGRTVYLTFDDGPGEHTERLLGYLDQYGVKATFFVTNQFPQYQSMIGKTHLKGHKIALHTLSHQWSIYSSVDAYMADFEAMQNVVVAQTGARTEIFRFPGGTNNTVSRRYKRGIMRELSNKMLNEGYVYFDWNCDCNDARHYDATSVIWDTITQISNKQEAVVLMHDVKGYTVDAVPAILEHCLKNGYTFKVLEKDSPAVRFSPVN